MVKKLLSDGDRDEIEHTAQMLLEDYAALPQHQLRYVAAALPILLPHCSAPYRLYALSEIEKLAETHEDPYKRKTAVKTLAKLTQAKNPDDPGTTIYSTDQNQEIVGLLIGFISSPELDVKEEALLSLSKRINTGLTPAQVTEILKHIGDPSKYDWYLKRILHQTLAAIEANAGG